MVRLDEMRSLASSPSGWTPPVDVCEMDDAILVRIELPGVSQNHVRVSMLDNVLKVEGRKERTTPTGRLLPELERPIRFICLERSFGNFAFSISLRWQIETSSMTARMTGGVLQVRLPKATVSGREITISITE